MTRWAPGAAGRLHDAALELFLENGFAATTVPQIAERAGLTTRSFFRYFADKREVLFTGEDELPGVVARMFDEADHGLTPMQMVDRGFRQIVFPRLESFRDEIAVRRKIVDTDEGLRERELRKLTILQDAAKQALLRRGLTPIDAEIMARLAVAMYDTTLELWLAQGTRTRLDDVLDTVFDAFERMATPV